MGAGAAAGQSPQRPRSLTRSQRPSQPPSTPVLRPRGPGLDGGKEKRLCLAASLKRKAPAERCQARPGLLTQTVRARACVLSGARASPPLQPLCPRATGFPPPGTHPAASPGIITRRRHALCSLPFTPFIPALSLSTQCRSSLGIALPTSSLKSAPPLRTSLSSKS